MKAWRRFTPEEVEMIAAMYRDGEKTVYIAAALDRHISAITVKLTELFNAGLLERRRPIS
jgi:predicted transcriptional regulator